MKKSQVAMEFLMTYGWAIMVLLIAIGAITYFGITDPSSLTADRCLSGPGFNCDNHIIFENSTILNIRNIEGYPITILTNETVAFDENENIISSVCFVEDESVNNVSVNNRDIFQIRCDFQGNILSEGRKEKIFVEFTSYRASSTSLFSKDTRTEIFSTVNILN